MATMQSKEDWLHDISWSWEGTATTHGKAGSRSKYKTYTLTMTHNPTGIRVLGSTPYTINKRELTRPKSSKLWMDLFRDLQIELGKRETIRK